MNIAILVNNIENNTNGGDTIARLNLNTAEYRTNLNRLSDYLGALASGNVSGVSGTNKCIVGGFTNAYGTITLASTGPVATNTFSLNSVTFTAIAAKTGTYSRTGSTITVSITSHGLSNGQSVYLDFTSGTATDKVYVITLVDSGSYTVVDSDSGSTSGNVTQSTGTQFSIGGSLTATAANIAGSINASVSDKISGVVTASASGAVVTITANAPGKLGNGNSLVIGTMANSTIVDFASSTTKGIEVQNVSF
jgi:hypothetical protein